MYVCMLSLIWLFATLWTVAHPAPLSTEFSRREYWSGLPFSTPGDLTQGSNSCVLHLLHWQVDSLPMRHQCFLTNEDIKSIDTC